MSHEFPADMPTDGLVPGEINPLEEAPPENEIGYISPPSEPYRYVSPVKRLTYFERLKLADQYGGSVHEISNVSIQSTSHGPRPRLVNASTQTPIVVGRTTATQSGAVASTPRASAVRSSPGEVITPTPGGASHTVDTTDQRVIPRSRHVTSPPPQQAQPSTRPSRLPLHSNELSPSLSREGPQTQRGRSGSERPIDGLTVQQRDALLQSTGKSIRHALDGRRVPPAAAPLTTVNRVLVRSKSVDDRKSAPSAVVASSTVVPSAAARSLLRRAYTRKLDQKTQVATQPSRQTTEFQTLEDSVVVDGPGNGIPSRSLLGASPVSKATRGEVSAKGVPRLRGSSATRSAPLLMRGAAPKVGGPAQPTAFRKANPVTKPATQHIDPAVNVEATTKRTHQLHNNIVAKQTALLNREKARAWQHKADDRV